MDVLEVGSLMGARRKFDWQHARQLRATGWTYTAIAERFGVSASAIRLACNDKARERTQANTSAWQKNGPPCVDCGTQITRFSRNAARHPKRCRPCDAKHKVKIDARGRYWCPTCGTWKAPDEFFSSSHRPARGVHKECRACDTARKRRWRNENRERQREYDRGRKRRARAAV